MTLRVLGRGAASAARVFLTMLGRDHAKAGTDVALAANAIAWYWLIP